LKALSSLSLPGVTGVRWSSAFGETNFAEQPNDVDSTVNRITLCPINLQCAIGSRSRKKRGTSSARCQKSSDATSGDGWDALQKDFSGDIKKLSAKTHEYRLRMGSLRALFTLEGNLISVYAVRDRKKAYE
jgi:hypothetical protein